MKISVTYDYDQCDISTKGLFLQALQKFYYYSGIDKVWLDWTLSDFKPVDQVSLQLDSKLSGDGCDVYDVIYDNSCDDADRVLAFITDCISRIDHYSYRTVHDMDTPKKTYFSNVKIFLS